MLRDMVHRNSLCPPTTVKFPDPSICHHQFLIHLSSHLPQNLSLSAQ
uniref:Uncharacterized protein n=1 Tax=Arundo donax TaxID=35708 RepID=A0A0A9A7K7_ARUDO